MEMVRDMPCMTSDELALVKWIHFVVKYFASEFDVKCVEALALKVTYYPSHLAMSIFRNQYDRVLGITEGSLGRTKFQ